MNSTPPPTPAPSAIKPRIRLRPPINPTIHKSVNPLACLGLLLLVAALWPSAALAYPPAPHHTLYGCVRDQYGTPLTDTNAQVILQTPSGVQLQTAVSPGLGNGINYALAVPMDALPHRTSINRPP